MIKDLPKVTFGFIHCNRLHYLKSSLESLLHCTEDYPNKEIIIVDNASVEEGTDEYLLEKEAQGFTIVRQEFRDPANEFAKGLNIVSNISTGDFVCPLQSDMQFILKSQWLQKYVEYYQKHIKNIGCMLFDAQRNVTNQSHSPYGAFEGQEFHNNVYNFVLDLKRNPITGAADTMYSKEVLSMIVPWNEQNDKHEGGGDSETKMLNKVQDLIKQNNLQLCCAVPLIPPAAAIYTDPRGTNARVRKDRRYGKYFAPKNDFMYYKINEFSDMITKFNSAQVPIGLEDIVDTIGYPKPIDSTGAWLKNPIDPDKATSNDYVELSNVKSKTEVIKNIAPEESTNVSDEELDEWLDS